MTKKELQEQKDRQAKLNSKRAKVQAMNAANNASRTPSKGELNRGQGTKPVKHGMTPAETQRYQALIYAARTPSKGETNRNKENRLVPMQDYKPAASAKPAGSGKTVPMEWYKPATATKSNLQSIKTKTSTVDKNKLEPIKNKRK